MDDIIRRALTGSPERPAVTFARNYRAPASEVRSACTDPERLARWFGDVEGEPHAVGDTFTAVLSDEVDDVATGRILKCEEELIAVSWSWQGERESVITIRITPVDDERATLTLHHALAEADHVSGYGGGWEQCLQALARSLGVTRDDAPSDQQLEGEAVARWRLIQRSPLQLEHVVPAPVEKVWAAFASAEGLKAWWWKHWSDVEIDADVREGGRYLITAPAAGVELHGSYLAVEPQRHLAYTWCWRDDDGEAPDEAVDLRFEPTPEGTKVIVRHTGPWVDDAPAESYRQGWEFTLDQLTGTFTRP